MLVRTLGDLTNSDAYSTSSDTWQLGWMFWEASTLKVNGALGHRRAQIMAQRKCTATAATCASFICVSDCVTAIV